MINLFKMSLQIHNIKFPQVYLWTFWCANKRSPFLQKRIFGLFFFQNHAWKLGVRIIHECCLYTSFYGNSQNRGPLTKTAVIYFQTSRYLELIALIVNNKNKLLYALNLSAPGQVWGKNIVNLWQKLFYNPTFESLYLPCFKRRYIIMCSVHLIRKAKGSVQ